VRLISLSSLFERFEGVKANPPRERVNVFLEFLKITHALSVPTTPYFIPHRDEKIQTSCVLFSPNVETLFA